MTLNITEGCYVTLRDGSICGPVRYDPDSEYCWDFGGFSWDRDGFIWRENEPSSEDIIEVLPGKPVFIDTPFEVGKTYRTRGGKGTVRGGKERTVESFMLRLNDGGVRKLDGRWLVNMDNETSCDLLPGAIEDEEEVTVTMPKADYERALELLKGAKG